MKKTKTKNALKSKSSISYTNIPTEEVKTNTIYLDYISLLKLQEKKYL